MTKHYVISFMSRLFGRKWLLAIAVMVILLVVGNEMARLHGQAEKREQKHKAELERVHADPTTTVQAVKSEAAERLVEARAETGRLIEQGTLLQKRMDAMAVELNKATADAKKASEEAAELRGRHETPGVKK